MLTRDTSSLRGASFDLLVVGAGINGSAIAWDAALRGMSVLLIDRGDFGGETSAGCFKIVHGGLRYLQHLDLRRLFRSVREQRTLRIIAPHLITPLPFLVPCYGVGKKGRAFLELGMYLYELLASNRNRGVREELQLPRHSVLGRDELIRLAPHVATSGLRGAVCFSDAQIGSCERLTLEVAGAARKAGATVASYVELLERVKGEGSSAFRLRDSLNGELFEVNASAVVNAAGPWADELNARLGAAVRPLPRKYVRGVQLVVPKLLERHAVAVESRDRDAASVVARGGRSYFLAPWNGLTLAGTSEEPYEGAADDARSWQEQAARFLSELREAYPSPALEPRAVRHVFGGLIPTEDLLREDEQYRVLRSDDVRQTSRDPVVLSVTGVKYTTFRILAEEVVDELERALKRSHVASRTAVTVLPGGALSGAVLPAGVLPDGEPVSRSQRVSPHVTEQDARLVARYGSRAEGVREILAEHSSRGAMVSASLSDAEVRFFVREEAAQTLSDVLCRRTELAFTGEALGAAAGVGEVMREELGWDRGRLESELNASRQLLSMTLE